MLNTLIAEIESEMEMALGRIPYSPKLLSIKGLGVVSVAGIIGEVGDFKKFQTRAEIMKLAGLDLYEISSDKWKGRRKISKRGRSLLRKILIMRRSRPSETTAFCMIITQGLPKEA
jgi:transposase